MRMRIALPIAALAAAVVPVIAAAPSQALVPTSTWEGIAACESGGNWHIDTGNGYYGGLQIAPSTWDAYGGRRYASLPSRTGKRNQIRVARKIVARQGWGAWPTCSARIGVR